MTTNSTQSQGDTQPLSQRVYDELTSRSKELQAAKRMSEVEDDDDDSDPEAVPHTLQQGETGHVDLIAILEQPSLVEGKNALEDNEDDDMEPLSPAADVRADAFPEFRRFRTPKTPASQGKKRKRGDEVTPQAVVSPQLPINPFAGRFDNTNDYMDPSQLFKATQAVSSPITNVVNSDGLSERPSPNAHLSRRPSSAGSMSSPPKLSWSTRARAVTEPQTRYISMKESQEARERLQRANQQLSHDDLSDDDFAEGDIQLRRRLKQKRIHEEAMLQFAGITSRSEPRSEGRRRGRGGRITHAQSKQPPQNSRGQASHVVLISDDPPIDETQGSITEDETEREEPMAEEEDDEVDELADENKENVEVPRTTSRVQHMTSQVIASQTSPSHRRSQNFTTYPEANGVSQVENSSQMSGLQWRAKSIEDKAQPDAIVDSQASQRPANPKEILSTHELNSSSEPRSTIDSRILVPQSQVSEESRATTATMRKIGVRGQEGTLLDLPNDPQAIEAAKRMTDQNRDAKNRVAITEVEVVAEREQKEGPSDVLQRLPLALQSLPAPQNHNTQPQSIFSEAAVSLRSPALETSSAAAVDHGGHELVIDSSGIMPSPRKTPQSASKAVSSHSVIVQSRASTLFETAKEQVIPSPSKSHHQPMRPRSQSESPSPFKAARPRTMSEIVADPSPPDLIGSVDVEFNLLSNDDIEFQNAISGSSPIAPARKRRRGAKGQDLHVAVPDPKQLSQPPHSPLPPPSSAISTITPLPSSDTEVAGPSIADVKANNARTDGQVSVGRKRILKRPSGVLKRAGVPTVRDTGVQLETAKGRQHASTTNPIGEEKQSTHAPQEASQPSPITMPNRVFAHFNGSNPAYYSATCLEVTGGGEPRYRVRFDDGTIDVISGYGIKRLELRAGDSMKVDLPGARTKSYIVEEMRDQQRPAIPPDPETPSRRRQKPSTNHPAFPETDIYGYATVLASPRPRQSTDGGRSESLQIAVPLTQVYLTQTMWTGYRDRLYTPILNPPSMTGLQTPEIPSTPSTPSSRTRQAKSTGRLKNSGLAQTSFTTTSTDSSDGIFKNMAFAITNIDDVGDSERAKRHILTNGGSILPDGFKELFEIPSLERTSSPKKTTDNSFHLTPAAKNLGFTCLVADKHCRRAKFIQALALGIPCLATRWISDCVSKQRILPWSPYLLPSGESSFLNGAISSRTLQLFPAETAKLSEIIENRPKMLDNASILLIMEKSQEDTMKFHPLFTHALGAKKVSRAMSEDAAAKSVADAYASGEPWDCVFSYDREDEVEKKLFGGSNVGRKRKRGRQSEVSETSVKKAKARVVGNEFVIQSLILGMLADE